MKLYIKILLLILLVWPKSFFGQTYFNMLYPPEAGTWGGGTETIVVTDSLYIMNRWAVNNADGMPWVGFTNINLEGDYISLEDTFHLANVWTAVAGLEKSTNNNFVDVIGYKNSNQSKDQYSIIKYDSGGHIIFNNVDTNLYPYIYIKQTLSLPNGNIISVGDLSLSNTDPNATNVLLIKSDSLGNQIWKKTYSVGAWAEKGESIALCADGGFIIGGAEIKFDGPDDFYSPIVIKTDSNGNTQWKRKFGSTEYSNWPAYGITQSQDGGYAFCGGVGVNYNHNIDNQAPWVVKLSSNGTVIWVDTNMSNLAEPDILYSRYRDIIENNDGSFTICGQQLYGFPSTGPLQGYKRKAVLKKLDKNGSTIWVRYITHPDITNGLKVHELYDIDSTPDGGFVAAGYATFTADDVQSTWVIKTDSFGCLEPGCEVNSVPKIEATIASLKIYPNPASEILNIEITPTANQQEFVFELYDILGKRVLTKTLQPNQNTINIQHLPSGVYTYKIGEVWGNVVVE